MTCAFSLVERLLIDGRDVDYFAKAVKNLSSFISKKMQQLPDIDPMESSIHQTKDKIKQLNASTASITLVLISG